MLPQNSSVWGEKWGNGRRTSRAKLWGGGGAQRVFGQIPKTRPTRAKLPGADTDSMMTEKNTTHEQERGPSGSVDYKNPQRPEGNKIWANTGAATSERSRNGPILNEGNNWLNYDWAQNDWGGRIIIVGECQWKCRRTGKTPQRRKTKALGKGRNHLHGWANQRQGPDGEVYARSDCALKTNARSAAKQMPLSGEFSGYSEWWGEAKRRAKTLYNRPVSSVVDYFIINLRASSEITDKESSGHLGRKLKIKVEENEEAVNNRVGSEPINAEWAFAIFRARHYEPAGKPITRITKHPNNLDA